MITRRRFLQGMGAAGVALSLERCTPGGPQKPTPRPAKPILVVVNLDGGNDWLSMMPPLSGNNRTLYERARPTLAIPTNRLDDLGGGVGLNQDLAGLHDLSKPIVPRIAWFPGVGMSNANLSHFVSIAYWGQGAANPNDTGWLGRFADDAFNPLGDVLRGLTVTSDVPLMLRGASRSFVAITRSSGFVYPAMLRGPRLDPATWDTQPIEDAFGVAVDPANADPASPGLVAAAATGKSFLDAQNGFGVNGALPARTPSVLYPGDVGHAIQGVPTGLASQLKLVAQMIANAVPAEIFFTRIGGFDTHANQAVDHPRLMKALGGSLRSFYDDLSSIQTPDGNALERTLIMGYSEFGRRVSENSGGTDHGKGGLAFCLGRGVAGGMYSAYPSLAPADLDDDNMVYTVDFRSLYATLLERWLGRSAAQTDALLGSTYPRLGFL